MSDKPKVVDTSYGMKDQTSRNIEHANSQSGGLARASGHAKTAWGPPPIHPSMENRTSTDIGAPPDGKPPDASSPNPLDPTRTKSYEKPKASWGMRGGDGQDVDHDTGDSILGNAVLSGSTRLPPSTSEN